jgi:hypothetical protein
MISPFYYVHNDPRPGLRSHHAYAKASRVLQREYSDQLTPYDRVGVSRRDRCIPDLK